MELYEGMTRADARRAGLRNGTVAAWGLIDGTSVIGRVVRMRASHFTIHRYSWWSLDFGDGRIEITYDDVEWMKKAEYERDHRGRRVYAMDPLGKAQADWEQAHDD